MTREKRKKKLANAIKLYRGKYNELNGAWIEQPQKDKVFNIIRWLKTLVDGTMVNDSLKAIDGFKHYNDFHKWISEL